MTEQIIEVDYDKELVDEYKRNYIMEEEGIGSDEAEPFDIQTTYNEDTFEEMNEEGEAVMEEVVNYD